MVCPGFLSYSINIDLPFTVSNFNILVGGFFCFFKKTINSEDTTMPPRRKNMHVLRGFSIFFFYWNSSNTKLPFIFNKNKVACKGVFIIFIWFYCKYHVGSGVIGYLYVYKLLFIFRNDWIMLSMRQRVGVSIVARCLYRGGPLSLGFSLSPLSSSRKLCCPLQKTVGQI